MDNIQLTSTSVLALEDTQKMIEQLLKDYFDENIVHAQLIGPEYTALWHAMQTLINAGGKRLRPRLVIMAFKAFSKKPLQTILPVAAAQELLHFGLLVHDDIIDRDYVRYGIKNVSGQLNELYKKFLSDETERRHFSDSAAMLAGDLAISGAYQLIIRAGLATKQMIDAQRILGDVFFAVAGGELLDMESTFRPAGTVDTVSVALHKTSSYSFVGPIVTGAMLADADLQSIEALRVYAQNLGIAYQLTDDLLGVFGDEKRMGKSASHDIREGKYTYLIEQCMKYANSNDMSILHDLFGKHSLQDHEAENFREMLLRCGAKERTEAAVQYYRKSALDALKDAHMDGSSRKQFENLVRQATDRAL